MSKLKEALDFLDSEDEKRAGSGMAAAGGGSAVDRALSFLNNASSGNSNAPARYAPADNANTAYQQYAKEYAQYGSQYQRQLVQGKTGRQWQADVNKRLEELQAQQSRYTIGRAMNTASSFLQKLKGAEEPDTLVSEVDAYDKQIARLRKEKEWADYFADAGLSDEVGYKTGSAAGQVAYKQAQAAKPANPREELEKQREAGEMDLATYQKYYQSTGDNRSAYWKYGTDTAWKEPSDSWTKDELTNFYYLYNESASEAEKYAERVNNKYNAAKAQEKKDEIGERAAKNGWTGFGATLASIPLTMTSLMDTAERAAEYSARGTVTQKADLTPADIGMAMTSAIHSALNEKSGTINDNIPVVGGVGLGDLYEAGVSVLNSLASVYMMGGVGTYANFFGQASKTAYEEGIQRGLSVDKALTYGYASGVAEVAGEIFSIEHLIKMKNPSSLKGIIKNIFVQGGIEASEESATTLMNTISDAIINGDKSELSSNYYALIQAGYSSEEASQLAISDWTQGIMYDALGGFVSGTVSGTIQSGVQGSMTYKGDAQELIDYAKSEGADTAAAKRAQKYEKRVQSGKRMTNYQAGTLTELAQEAVVSKDLDNIREAVGKRLSALGENSSALTEAVVRQAVQQEAKAADVSVPKVTEKQRGLIQNSKAAKRVLSEMDIGNMRMETAAELSGHDSSQYQRSNEWARDIGTRIIAPGEYGVRSTNTVTAEEKRADVTVNGESGKVVGFKNGMARVEVTENGKSTIREVKPDDVQQLPKQTRRLFDEISRYDGDTQAAMYAAYMPGQDIEAYVQAADTAMNLYGAQTKATLEQARSFGKATFRMLSDAQLDALMQAGRKLADQRKAAAERTGESKGEVKQGKVSYDGGEAEGRKLKAPSKEAIDRMSDAEKTLAEALTATGVNVVFYESEANAEGKYSGAQGMYHNGTVYLDVNAGMNSVENGQRTIVLTAAHEMTHFIRENSEAGYIALREFITDRLMQQGLDIEELVTQKRARESRELSYDEAVEEVIADACETVLTEPTAIQQLASDNMPLAKKIRKWLSDFFRKIKSAFAGLEAVHDEAKAMTDYMDELRAMWDDALSDAVRNRANKNAAENGGGAIRYSIREDAPAEIHKAVTDKSYQGDIWLTDTSPSLMLGHKGVRNLPMMMKASHIRENILTKQEAAKLGLDTGKGINYHGLGEEVFKKVIDSLDDISVGYRGTPKAKDPSRRENSFLLISTVKDNGRNTIVVPVYINEMGSYNRVFIRTNKIASVYGKSSLNEYIKREVARGNLVRIKKRSPAISESSAPIAVDYNGVTSQAKAADQTAMAFGNTSIRSSSENSNTKIKKSERDVVADNKTAEAYFGRTYKISEAGYLLRNGHMLDFSGRHEGAPGGYRTVDHRDISDAFDGDYGNGEYSDAMVQFMRAGNIRLSPESGGINLSVKPTKSQTETLERYIQNFHGEVMLDIDNEAGETVASAEYGRGTRASTVLDAINDYFDNGVIPGNTEARYSNRDVDLTAKYPQLNLNEDISELDGVPAIELTDGSVLPITERDGRYPTHVSFIEANRIDVDDLKSGGWIGNGVYDPSFTSDTQRYIERQQARKRVAELTGKPYEQFRYSMRDDAMTDRELLARALDSVAATESERKLLAQYRTEFDRYQELYDKLDDAQIEYSAARRAVDDAYAQAKRSKLTAEERRRTEGAWRERIGALKATQQETREARDKLLKEVDAQDRKLLKLRAMNPVKDMLSRARADMRETIKARQSKTDTREKVRDMAKKLSDLLLKESKDKHVLLELQKPVAEVLDMLNLDTVNAAERVAKYDAAIAKTTDPEMKRELAETRDRIQAQGDRLKTRLDALHTAYQAIANSADPTVANGYDENIAAKMQEVSQLVGDTPLAKMTQEQLDAVHDLLKMTYTVVSKANKAFVLNQKAGIEERAQAEIDRLSATEGADLGLKPVQFAKRQFWSMLKPGEIFHKVGGELEQAYNEVRKGEDVRARDVVTARSFFQQAAEKHGYFSWALEEKHDFVSAQGRPFSLSLDDMMSVYATSRREQGKKHLEAGGIVFGKNGKIKVKKKGVTLTMSQIKARAYTLDEQVLDEIIGKLTPEQKAFVEEMENWLSTKPAEWGNEVSRELYGINLFKEKVYWPIKSASEYLQSRSGDSDNVKIKNSGFTRSTVEKANNPIYIGGFVDTWSQHVYEMATYHGFTLPLEDFTRIFNYATSASDIENGANSVKAMLTNAFGSEAPVQQIELLLKDVNGSARSDPTTELMNKGLAFMKKYAVAGSLSVSIQQPSAIARATAYIDPKYFVGEKITAEKHKELWEHMKKYAPVAAIKEIGYFDQGLGRSAREWMTAREYDGLAEKAKGLVTDSNYRSDVIMALPGLMDELTWCSIWQAVEREVADTTNLKTGSEEFNKRVGDRFTQIITETQVYDSVFSRSAMMRSKDVGVKMATAFMAEPLTNVSMVVDAIDDFRNGRTALGARKLGSVVASMLLNSILVSFVYAARNDDDDKSYIEKYIAALTGELKDGFNPLTYIPYIKDVVSIVQGYDVERNDMTMIADLWNAYTSLKSDKKSTYRKIEDFAGRIAQIFGLPLKNVMRDMRAAYYTYDTIANGEETTWKGALQAVAEGWTGESPSNSEQLYDALVSGNAKQADRVKARFEDESAAQAAVKKVIREKFAPTDGGKQSMDKQTAIKQLQDYAGMSKQEAEKQVAKWTVSLAYGFEYGDTKDEYLNGNITIDKAKRVLMGAGATDMEADAKTLQWKFEKDTGIAYDDMSDAYVSGDISRSDAVNYLVKYGKTYRADAEATVQQWQCEKDTGFKYGELKDLYVAGTISADRAAALRSKYGGASEDDAKSTVLQWQCVKDTGIEYSDIRKAYEEKRVSGETVENMLMKYGGKSKDDAAARREKYDFTIANPGTEDISDAAVQKYNESVAAAGISGKDYYTSWQMYNRTESDYDENGKPISYSKLYKIAAYIDSLNLTNAQKDAMFCAFYTARNLRRTPWH